MSKLYEILLFLEFIYFLKFSEFIRKEVLQFLI